MNNRSFKALAALFGAAALALFALFGVVQDAAAELTVGSTFYVLDADDRTFKNSNVDVFLNGEEVDVLHEFDFNTDDYVRNDGSTNEAICDINDALTPAEGWLDDCPDTAISPTNGQWAGLIQLTVPFTKEVSSQAAYAISYTIDWRLVDCDLDGDEDFDGDDLDFDTVVSPPDVLANWDIDNPGAVSHDPADYYKVLSRDVVTPCSNNTCDSNLVTTLFIDLDINADDDLTMAGDGTPVDEDSQHPSGRVCFFARVFTIEWPTNPPSPAWDSGSPPQARIGAGGGDKTVSLNLFGPTAITLENLTAGSPAGLSPILWLSLFVLLAAAAFALIRVSRRGSGVSIAREHHPPSRTED